MPRPVAALDIDGVVADVRHRRHLIGPGRDRWVRFFDAADRDRLLPEGARLAHQLAVDHDIVWLTGRPERVRDQTRHWLTAHGLPDGHLVMHPERDQDDRPTREIKRDFLVGLRDSGREVAVVFDDDPTVVELLRAEGLPSQLAEWCPYSPTYQTSATAAGTFQRGTPPT